MSGTVCLTHTVPKTLEKILQAGTGAGSWWTPQDNSLNVIISRSQCPARVLVPAGQECSPHRSVVKKRKMRTTLCVCMGDGQLSFLILFLLFLC